MLCYMYNIFHFKYKARSIQFGDSILGIFKTFLGVHDNNKYGRKKFAFLKIVD